MDIADSTLKILNLSRKEWLNLLEGKQLIKKVKETLLKVHPDKTNEQTNPESIEIIEYLSFLSNKESNYRQKYLDTTEEYMAPPTEYHADIKINIAEKSRLFFAQFKSKMAQKFNHNWEEAFNHTFIVKTNKVIDVADELSNFVTYFNIYHLNLYRNEENHSTKYDFSNLTEKSFDQALEIVYWTMTEVNFTYSNLLPHLVCPPSFIEDRELLTKVLSIFPSYITCITHCPYWKQEDFWSTVLTNNPKIWNFLDINTVTANSILLQYCNSKEKMCNALVSNYRAIRLFGDELKKELMRDVKELAWVIKQLGITTECRHFISSLPENMRAIDGPLAQTLLSREELDIESEKFFVLFENSNPSVFFYYLNRACVTYPTKINDHYVITELDPKYTAYASAVIWLVEGIRGLKLNVTAQSTSNICLSLEQKNALNLLENYLNCGQNINALNEKLFYLTNTFLKPNLERWLHHKDINTDLEILSLEKNPKITFTIIHFLTSLWAALSNASMVIIQFLKTALTYLNRLISCCTPDPLQDNENSQSFSL